jgi:hypothetical protein
MHEAQEWALPLYAVLGLEQKGDAIAACTPRLQAAPHVEVL